MKYFTSTQFILTALCVVVMLLAGIIIAQHIQHSESISPEQTAEDQSREAIEAAETEVLRHFPEAEDITSGYAKVSALEIVKGTFKIDGKLNIYTIAVVQGENGYEVAHASINGKVYSHVL